MSLYDLGGMVVLGLAGTLHCAGMCGGFVLCLGRTRGRQVAYQSGRLLAYGLAGAALGVLGLSARVTGGPTLTLAAAGLMILVGLGFLGLVPRVEPVGPLASLVKSRLAGLLRRGTAGAAFGLGLVTGLLPCGLLYAAFARAAASHSPLEGAALMAAFWLGSSPGLLGMAAAGPLLARWNPAWWPRLAGACAVTLGIMTAWGAFTKASCCH